MAVTKHSPTVEQPEWLKSFIPLPSDPEQLTIEHVRTAFAGDRSALKDVVKAAQEVIRTQNTVRNLSTE